MYHKIRLKREIQKPIKSKNGVRMVTKKAIESYLVNSQSVTESEVKFYKWLPSDFENPVVESSQVSQIVEILTDESIMIDGNTDYYMLKINAIDGDTGNVKPYFILANGLGIKDCIERAEAHYSKYTKLDLDVVSATKSQIIVDKDLISDNEMDIESIK